jgi:hypothetical protein
MRKGKRQTPTRNRIEKDELILSLKVMKLS